MSKFVLIAESGADIDPQLVERYQIHIVPMHVSFGEETLNDLDFPAQKVFDYYNNTGTVPKTSGCNPEDFIEAFDEVHAKFPDKHILHLAYSAITTCSFQSAMIASEGRDYVTSIDTKQVSVAQGIIVVKTAQYLEENPNCDLDELVAFANGLIDTNHMGFFPDDLAYLRAGGRVSNAAYMGAKILNLHPLIEIIDGKLTSTKKYRGSMRHIVPKLLKDLGETYNFDKDFILLGCTEGTADIVKEKADLAARELGYKEVMWMYAGCVICTHGGPGAFGIVGFSKK